MPLQLPPYQGFGRGPFGGGPFGVGLPLDSAILPLRPDYTEDEVLSGSRVTDFTFDLLDNDENYLGTLSGVEASASSLKWTSTAAIKGAGQLGVRDLNQQVGGSLIDWSQVRIRPWVIIEPADGTPGVVIQKPLGVWLPAAPKESWDDTGRIWEIDLLEKTSLLDQDCMTDIDVGSGTTGNAVVYSVDAGANIIDTVRTLISIKGGGPSQITQIPLNSKTVPATGTGAGPLTWDAGTSVLKIVNDLLALGGFYSLYNDYYGQFQCPPYVLPSRAQAAYQVLLPFSDTGVMAPAWEHDRDIYAIPNRYSVIGVGDDIYPPWESVAVNVDPTSPFSYPSRGRWITQVETGVEAASQADLDTYAQKQLQAASSATSKATLTHLLLPDLRVNNTITFTNEAASLDALGVVMELTVPLDPLAMCTTLLQEAVNVTSG